MASSNKRRELTVFGLAILVLFLGMVASVRFAGRIDLTQDRSMSISPVSKGLFKEIPEQLRITYYVSGRLLKERPEPQRVEDMLREYAASSHGKIRVEVVDPDKSGDAQTIQSWGITPRQYQVDEQNQFSVANVYTGIAVEYLDKRQVLPFVWDATTLEYDLTRAVRMAVRGTGRVAVVVLGDQGKTWANDYRMLSQALTADGWEVREAESGQPLPDDASVVLVLGDSGLSEPAFYAVDQYLMKGGRVFVAARGVDIKTDYGLYALPVAADNPLLTGLKAYGVTVGSDLVMDEAAQTWPQMVQAADGSVGILPYPFWVAVQQAGVSRDSPITSRFSGLSMLWASSMSVSAPEGVKAEVLAKTSKKAWTSTKDYPINPQESYRFTEERSQTAGQYALAAALSGTIPSAFAGKPAPKGAPAPAAGAVPAAKSSPEARLVVASSADFANDMMYYAQSESNATFITNALNWLTADDDLLSIKARSYRDDRLNLVADAAARKNLIALVYAVILGLIPAGVVGYGVYRIVRRKRRAVSATVKGKSE